MNLKIDMRWDENEAYAYDRGWFVTVSDAETGSSTSFAESTWANGVEQALKWGGIDGVEINPRVW